MTLDTTPCPRCGCYAVQDCRRGCGAVRDRLCSNCGRWKSLAGGEHLTLAPTDAVCTAGPVPHEHSNEERIRRVRRYMGRGYS